MPLSNKKIMEIWFTIFLETLLIIKAVIATSPMAVYTSGIILKFTCYYTNFQLFWLFIYIITLDLESKDICLNENEHNTKELVDRIKDLELQFQLHVSESKSKSEDQFEEIVILKAARKAQEGKLQIVLNEMEVLKAKNRDQAARIEQLEKILKIKSDTTKPNINAGLAISPSSCEDLKSNGHHLNGIYMIYDVNVKKVLATYCDFSQSSETG